MVARASRSRPPSIAGARRARDGWTRERLLADARKMHGDIAKDKRPFGAPWAALIEGALAHAGNDCSRARDALERAVAGFDRAGMALYREAARFRLAELTASTVRRDEAGAWLKKQGVPDPRAIVDALVPGLRLALRRNAVAPIVLVGDVSGLRPAEDPRDLADHVADERRAPWEPAVGPAPAALRPSASNRRGTERGGSAPTGGARRRGGRRRAAARDRREPDRSP